MPAATPHLSRDARLVWRALHPLPDPVVAPALVLLCGLPGTGKTTLATQVAQRVPVVVLTSDWVRKLLIPQPVYSHQEHQRVFLACRQVLRALLTGGVPVIFDAVNLWESGRRDLVRLAERQGGRSLVVALTVDPAEAARRLHRRHNGGRAPHDLSDAGWEVYQAMAASAEPLRLPHLALATDRDDLAAMAERVAMFVRGEGGSAVDEGEAR